MESIQKFKSDTEIIDLYWQRDESAIFETDKKYRNYLLSVASRFLCDKRDKEECLEDTYMGAWNKIPPERPNVLKAYLSVIIRRCAIRRFRENTSKKRIPSEYTVSLLEIEDMIEDKSHEEEVNSQELARIISEFLSNLSDRDLFIFMNRYYMAKPIKEIAKNLKVSESTVNKDIAAIKHDLRKKLKKEGFTL